MNSAPSPGEMPSSSTQRAQIETLCADFESAWRNGQEPDIRFFLSDRASDLRPESVRDLLFELIAIDQEYRWRRAAARGAGLPGDDIGQTLVSGSKLVLPERPLLEDYLDRFPEMGSRESLPVDCIAAEYYVRQVYGDRPARTEYAQRFATRSEEVTRALTGFDATRSIRPNTVVFEILAGPPARRQFVLDGPAPLLVGRAPEAQIRLAEDPRVSAYHCRLEVNPPDCYLTDLGSRNGTLVNSEPVRERFLVHGDRVQVGDTTISFAILTHHAPCPDVAADLPTAPFVARQPADSRSAIMESVPGYDIVRQIGKGGMGVVYEAIQKSSGDRVVLKMVVPAIRQDDRAIQFFLREASTLSRLHHKRIVRFLGVRWSGGRLVLAMEYVQTIDLGEYLAAKREESRVRHYCGIICQVLDALGYAHEQGVVHRDIKPSNILVARSGNRLRTKVADFGLAKNFQDAGFSEMTGGGERRGTVPFMPPEQIEDPCYAKPAADIYSAGATLYYYLAGRYPHDFSSTDDPMATVAQIDPTPIESLRPDLPTGLAETLHTALARRPEDRFASAREMYRALYSFAKG